MRGISSAMELIWLEAEGKVSATKEGKKGGDEEKDRRERYVPGAGEKWEHLAWGRQQGSKEVISFQCQHG